MGLVRSWRRWRRVVTPTMVQRCTASRLSGDWRAAAQAAGYHVDINLGAVARRWRRAEAERLEADLVGLAPDLLRLYDDGRPTVLSRVAGQ